MSKEFYHILAEGLRFASGKKIWKAFENDFSIKLKFSKRSIWQTIVLKNGKMIHSSKQNIYIFLNIKIKKKNILNIKLKKIRFLEASSFNDLMNG